MTFSTRSFKVGQVGINENTYEALRTNERVRRTAKHIVPLYDPKAFDRFPRGIVR